MFENFWKAIFLITGGNWKPRKLNDLKIYLLQSQVKIVELSTEFGLIGEKKFGGNFDVSAEL